MYLKKLELVGFKSFCNKTVLNFEPGITAVVGPNGTGKSNIFDSMRWVLGEQSIKELRGSDMQDVIFNGTDTKEPLGMAEVSLIFDNKTGFFGVDNDEVSFTRRIFRSGESEYLLNKAPVRLKDILDLLMGTGIGAESYSLVAQGKIDLILSSRPEDRRLVFDEASGITKYKSQKKEATRRLEETEQNLMRINDIILEVRRQIGSLERQANKARKYKEVFEELKSKELDLAILRKINFSQQKEELTKQLEELGGQQAEVAEKLLRQESQINQYQAELKTYDGDISSIKDELMNLNNFILRNKERINFNKEKIAELEENKKYLEAQVEQTKNRLGLDEGKLNNIKQEYAAINKNAQEKTELLRIKEGQLSGIAATIKASLENIANAKKTILELVTKIANIKNEANDSESGQQIYLARKKRLAIEQAKINEEKAVIEASLNSIAAELNALEADFQNSNLKIAGIKDELGRENLFLSSLDSQIQSLEEEGLKLQSQKNFLEELKTKYENLGESMNAVIYLDKMPQEFISGLVIKVKNVSPRELKLSGEAKSLDLDTQKIDAKISQIEEKIRSLGDTKAAAQGRIEELNKSITGNQESLRNLEISLANKRTTHQTISENFNKIKEEEDIIAIELSDVDSQLGILGEKAKSLRLSLADLEIRQKQAEELIAHEQNAISINGNSREETLMVITQAKTELDALSKRVSSEQATLKILQDSYEQDKQGLLNLQNQIQDNTGKQASLDSEITGLENKIKASENNILNQGRLLEKTEAKHQEILAKMDAAAKETDSGRKALDSLKNKLYESQMQNKDTDYKYQSIKDRILQAYQIDLDAPAYLSYQPPQIDENIFQEEIEGLKDRISSYGTVNLVAIEEYDELKKRYDFLIQQQTDLTQGKESLHEAILKINRTTKKMFLETFEKIQQEFRVYFKLLFGGGDAQILLTDEQDPLESGIEIICRPPGKKLQNVLLLSGGEKALSAIGLIFAIFKIKPAPFCVLDEIDAALDEANVDRFSQLLQEFAGTSQFIVITHNKKTIANANVMYGITMEESGVSKIVSVKFAKDKELALDKEPDAEPVGEPA